MPAVSANLICLGRVFESVHLILDRVSNVFGLVQAAVKLKKKLFVRHQCRVGDPVSGKVIGNVVADQGNAVSDGSRVATRKAARSFAWNEENLEGIHLG